MKDQNSLEGKNHKCTLTDEQLVDKVHSLVHKLIKTGGRSFTMCVPANLNEDDDMVFTECANRLHKYSLADSTHPTKQLYEAVENDAEATNIILSTCMRYPDTVGKPVVKFLLSRGIGKEHTQVQEGEVEKLREALKATHKKFNELVKAMIKDMLLPEKQIDECCQILEANNVLLFDKSPISHE